MNNSSASNGTVGVTFGIDPWLQGLQHDIEAEWRGKDPSANFYLLLASLLLMIAWVTFVCFYFSRLLGFIGIKLLKLFLNWSGVSGVNHFSVGSFSISILSGKVMHVTLHCCWLINTLSDHVP